MKAVRSEGGRPVVVDVPEPSGPGVTVRIASAGICGSDLHLVGWDLPVVLGHEMAGTLDDGTPVAVEPIAPCGECERCREGAYNLCPTATGVILGVGADGGMAERCIVPSAAIVPLPAGVDPKDACIVEPLAIGVHGMRRARAAASDAVAIVGGGSIGLTAVAAAQGRGASVEIEARHDHQKEAAEQLGAGFVPDDAQGRYDLVVEAAGTQDALARAAALARPGGRVLVLGTYWDDTVLPGIPLSMKEVDLVPASMYGSAGGRRDIEEAAAILAERPELGRVLVTHRFPLDAAPEAFAAARDRATGAIKVVLEP